MHCPGVSRFHLDLLLRQMVGFPTLESGPGVGPGGFSAAWGAFVSPAADEQRAGVQYS